MEQNIKDAGNSVIEEEEKNILGINDEAGQKEVIAKKSPIIILISLFGLLLLIGIFYVGLKAISQKELPNEYQPPAQEIIDSTVVPPEPTLPLETKSSVVNQHSSVFSPEKYGFSEIMDLKAIGVKAKFPKNVSSSLREANFYVITASEGDAVSFALKIYDGGGRRAWFQKEYPLAKNYVMESFAGEGHSGYIAYAVKSEDLPGAYFYFTIINNKMLVVMGNNASSESVFFSEDLQKFKSFLSTIVLTSKQNVTLDDPNFSELYRWSDARKTVWEDANLGLKITTPEWTESRLLRDRDAEGKYTYTEWVRISPEVRTYDTPNSPAYMRRVEVTGGYLSPYYVEILPLRFEGESFSEVANELLISAGFCASEWKSSKENCTNPDFCYTKEEVIQNLTLERQIKIGDMDAQLRGIKQDFSSKYDCRSEGNIWLIKAKNGLFVSSNLSAENEGTMRLETL